MHSRTTTRLSILLMTLAALAVPSLGPAAPRKPPAKAASKLKKPVIPKKAAPVASVTAFPQDAALKQSEKRKPTKKGTTLRPGDVVRGSQKTSIDIRLVGQGSVRL